MSDQVYEYYVLRLDGVRTVPKTVQDTVNELCRYGWEPDYVWCAGKDNRYASMFMRRYIKSAPVVWETMVEHFRHSPRENIKAVSDQLNERAREGWIFMGMYTGGMNNRVTVAFYKRKVHTNAKIEQAAVEESGDEVAGDDAGETRATSHRPGN